MPPQTPSVRAFTRPYHDTFERYGACYRAGLRSHMKAVAGHYREESVGQHPRILAFMRRGRNAYRMRSLFRVAPWLATSIDGVAHALEGSVGGPVNFEMGVSWYLLRGADDVERRVCVDANDSGAFIDEGALAWCEIYFKTNYWEGRDYHSKVQPFINADPIVLSRTDGSWPSGPFARLRAAPKRYDVSMIVRVWGGSDEISGVEHNLRVLEAVAKVRGTKFLFAYLVAGDIGAIQRRLERQGIPCGTDPMQAARLWEVSAQSRLNVIRLGMHHCVPWRMTGALAIGSTVVLDRPPLSRWPEPLREGSHYLALDASTGPDLTMASEAAYAAIPGRIEQWLAKPAHMQAIAANNARYFDEHVALEPLGRYLFSRTSELGRPSLPQSKPAGRVGQRG